MVFEKKVKEFAKDKNTHQELKFFGLLLLYFVVFFPLQFFFGQYMDSWNPIIQFILLNLTTYLLLIVVFKAVALGLNWWQLILKSFGTVLGFIALDIIQPEFHVSFWGVLEKGATFGMASSDYVLGYIYHGIGVSGFWLWIMVYPVTCIVLLSVYAIIEKNFVKKL